jgi:ABC-type polysaccharide/polyol phosphate export permease
MFFFSRTGFPIDSLPRARRPFVELLPLTCAIRRLRRRIVV